MIDVLYGNVNRAKRNKQQAAMKEEEGNVNNSEHKLLQNTSMMAIFERAKIFYDQEKTSHFSFFISFHKQYKLRYTKLLSISMHYISSFYKMSLSYPSKNQNRWRNNIRHFSYGWMEIYIAHFRKTKSPFK